MVQPGLFVFLLCFGFPGGDHPPSLSDVAWIAGTWEGTKGDSFIQEIWTEPEGSAMIGMFRLVSSGEAQFYEFMSLDESDGAVVLSIKHFGGDMTGWEEKDESERFTLKELKGTVAVFDHEEEGRSLTFSREGDSLTITLKELRNGKPVEVRFDFRSSP